MLRLILVVLYSSMVTAQVRSGRVEFFTQQETGSLDMGRMALGQGGLSEEPMWELRTAEIRALHPKLIRLFIQEYFDLLPEHGVYNFQALDRSVDLILRTGAKPLMNIDFKPHVLYPRIDQDVVEPNDWTEWENLIAAIVRHYKERHAGIQYWEIANEPDIGEDGGCPYRFTAQNYLPYYKRTAEAVLRADPDARVGGPALASWTSPILPAFLDYCANGHAPVHFVSWHLYSSSPESLRNTITGVKQLIEAHPNLHVETILDEWNMALMRPDENNIAFQPAFILETIKNFLDAGLDYSCYYHIRDYHVELTTFSRFMSSHGAAFMASWWNRMPQYDGLFDFQNEIRPAYFAFKLLSRMTGRQLRTETDMVHALAVYDKNYEQRSLLVWNFSPDPVRTTIAFDGLAKAVTVNRVKLDAHTPSSDDSARLRFQPPEALEPVNSQREVVLEPYGIELWFYTDN